MENNKDNEVIWHICGKIDPKRDINRDMLNHNMFNTWINNLHSMPRRKPRKQRKIFS